MSLYDHSRDYAADYPLSGERNRTEPFGASIWRALRQRRWTIIAAALGGLAFGLASGIKQEPEYEAVSILKLRRSGGGLETPLSGARDQPAGLGRAPDPAVRARRIQSVAVNLVAAEAVVGRSLDAPSSWKKRVRSAARRIETRVSPDAQIVEIVSRAPDPEMAAELANAVAIEVVFGETSEFTRTALEDAAWREASMRERLEALRRLDAELARGLTAEPRPNEAEASPVSYLRRQAVSRERAEGSFDGIRVIRVAHPDYEPLSAGWQAVLSNGALSGILLGLMAVVFEQFGAFRRLFDRHILRPGEAARLLHLKELGALPNVAEEARRGRMTPAGRDEPEPLRAETASFERPASWVAEHVRSLRTSLIAQEPGRTRLIVVTSPNPGEGKTTVAANLAASLAELGHRTVLVDASMRRPRIHQVFNLRNRRGLFDLLTGKSTDRASLLGLTLKVSPKMPLWMLPAGVAPHGGPGLLHEAAGRELLEALASEFDNVVVDAPPVLMVSDARALARLADGVVLVVRAGVTDPSDAIEAKQWLWEEGAHLLGVVLNAWDCKKHGSRRYERYAESYPMVGSKHAASSAA